MAKLIECPGCKGLKRIDSARCPHCLTLSSASSRFKRSLTAAGLGAMVACGPSQMGTQVVLYGAICLPETDAGVCAPCLPPQTYDPDTNGCVSPLQDAGGDAGLDSGTLLDGGLDSGFSDSGTLTDGGSDGQSFVGTDAYGIPPFRDAGSADGGSGDDDD